MALKLLKDIKLSGKLKGTILSGFKSDDSKEELLIAEPLQEHPEIKGLYRAFDPKTGWKTWVEYTPPPEEVEPLPVPTPVIPTPESVLTEEEIKYKEKLRELIKNKELVDLGVIEDSSLTDLRNEVKALATELGKI